MSRREYRGVSPRAVCRNNDFCDVAGVLRVGGVLFAACVTPGAASMAATEAATNVTRPEYALVTFNASSPFLVAFQRAPCL